MKAKIGPTGEYSLGQPQTPGDRGGVFVGIKALKTRRQVLMNFGTVLEYIQSPIPETNVMVKALRELIHLNWGLMLYDKTTLPLKVELINGASPDIKLVRISMTQPTAVLVANPELWLALCETIEDRVTAAGYSME